MSGKHNAEKLDVRLVRCALVMRGDSLYAWAKRRGYRNCGFIHQICAGDRHGPKSRRILAQLRKETGL